MEARQTNAPQTETQQQTEALSACRTLAERMRAYQPPAWDLLPDLGLYMDQVITFLERQLSPLHPAGRKEKILTPAMVNNYVKMQVIPRPTGKKYERGHLAALLMLCALKPVLPMDAIGRLLASQGENIRAGYEAFCAQQRAAFQQVSASLTSAEADALGCAVQASALCLATEMLLFSPPSSEKA